MIDWTRTQKRNNRTRYAVTCPTCGQVRYLARTDALKAERQQSPCFACSQRIKGRKGYRALADKHGALVAITRVQTYMLANPSDLERRCMAHLDALGIPYEREVVLSGPRNFLVDFVIDGRYAIEVNGGCHINHIDRDRLKANAIRKAGYRLLVVDADTLTSERISNFLEINDHVYSLS